MSENENKRVLSMACEGGKTASATFKRIFLEDKRRKTKKGKPVTFVSYVRNVKVFWPCGSEAKFPITRRAGSFSVSDSRNGKDSGLDLTERFYTLGQFQRVLARLVGEGAAAALIGHALGA